MRTLTLPLTGVRRRSAGSFTSEDGTLVEWGNSQRILLTEINASGVSTVHQAVVGWDEQWERDGMPIAGLGAIVEIYDKDSGDTTDGFGKPLPESGKKVRYVAKTTVATLASARDFTKEFAAMQGAE